MFRYFNVVFCLLIFVIRYPLSAQDNRQDNPQDGHFTGSIAAGPNLYFNNIKTFGEYVRPFNYSFIARIMWNSRYLVSLGIETGYNKFYQVRSEDNDAINTSLAAIPLHLVMGMRITKSFYANFSFGPSVLLNSGYSETPENSFHNRVISYADGSVCIGYRKRIHRDFTVGAEVKFNFSTKATDMNLALPVVVSYDF